MPSASAFLSSVSEYVTLEHAIMGDILAIDDVDDFVSESEDQAVEFLCRELNATGY